MKQFDFWLGRACSLLASYRIEDFKNRGDESNIEVHTFSPLILREYFSLIYPRL